MIKPTLRLKFELRSGVRIIAAFVALFLSQWTNSGVAFAASSDTQSALIFGPEWTFTNDKLIAADTSEDSNRPYVLKLREKVQLHFAKYCQTSGKCKYLTDGGSEEFQILTPFGTYLTLGTDPGVFEVQSEPRSLEQWRAESAYYQEVIFDNFKKIGLKPHLREGAGHLNIGIQYFEKNPKLLRNFIVDFYNHPGVGVVLNSLTANQFDSAYLDQWFERNHTGATSLSVYQSFENFYQMALDKLGVLDAKKNYALSDVREAVLLYTIPKWVALGLRGTGSRFEATVINGRSRIEIRALRPQASMADFVRVIEIFEARVKFLSRVDRPLALLRPEPIEDGWKALGQFADYLAEAGLNWQNYKTLMPQEWRELPEGNFIRKIQNKNATAKSKMRSCRGFIF